MSFEWSYGFVLMCSHTCQMLSLRGIYHANPEAARSVTPDTMTEVKQSTNKIYIGA
jgi:hypothetical protein